MACLVKRDNFNHIVDVITPSGESSQLYNQIATLPFVENENVAFGVFSNVVDKNSSMAENSKDSKLIFETGAGKFNTLLEALKNSNNDGIRISAGGVTVTNINTALGANDFNSKLLNLISDGVISQKSELYQGQRGLVPVGDDTALKVVNMHKAAIVLNGVTSDTFQQNKNLLLIESAPQIKTEIEPSSYHTPEANITTEEITAAQVNEIITNGITADNYTVIDPVLALLNTKTVEEMSPLEIKLYNALTNSNLVYSDNYPTFNSDSQSALASPDGGYVVKNISDITNEDLEKYPTAINEVVKNAQNEIREKTYGNVSSLDASKILTEQDKGKLTNQLLTILNNLGVKVESLSNYVKSYKNKNGIAPSVEALSDISNRIIAIANNGNYEANLSEETAHFLVEAYNKQDEIRAILPMIETTDEWANESAKYYNLYEQQGLKGENLTEKVQREILGKIIANKLSNEVTRQGEGLLNRIKRIVDKFFNRVKVMLNPTVESHINRIADQVVASALEESKLGTDFDTNFLDDNQLGLFYSAAESTTSKQLSLAYSHMLKQSSILNKTPASKGIKSKLETFKTRLDNYEVMKSVASYLDMSESIYRDLNIKVKKLESLQAKGDTVGGFISQVEYSSASLLVDEIQPMLNELKHTLLRERLETPEDKRYRAGLIKSLDGLSGDIANLQGSVRNIQKIAGLNLMNELAEKYRLPDSFKEDIDRQLNNQVRDVTMLMANMGNMQNTNNPVLQMFNKLVNNMYTTVRNKDIKVFNDFLSKLQKLGFSNSNQLKPLIKKNADGSYTRFNKSIVDWTKFYEAKDAETIKIYNEALRMDKSSLPDVTEASQIGRNEYPKVLDLSPNARDHYRRGLEQWVEDNTEQAYNESFAKKRQQMFDEIKDKGITLADGTRVQMAIPESVKEKMKEWARRRREIKEPYNKNGKVDYSQMSEVELSELDAIKRERKFASSMTDSFSLATKTGEDLEIAKAFQAINAYYAANNENSNNVRSLSSEFVGALSEFTKGKTGADLVAANRHAWEFFIKNSGISFNENFWDNLSKQNQSIADRVETYLENAEIDEGKKEDLRLIAGELSVALSNRSQFLKQFSNPNNPSEVDAQLMPGETMSAFRELEQRIESLYKEINAYSAGQVTGEDTMALETTANDAYSESYERAKELDPFLDEMTFMLSHMTNSNNRRVTLFSSQLRDYERSKILPITGNFKYVVSNLLNLNPEASNSEIKQALDKYLENADSPRLDRTYAQSKLAGYFKRFAPEGYSEFYSMLKSGNIRDTTNTIVSLDSIISQLTNTIVSDKTFTFKNSLTGKNVNLMNLLSVNPEVEWMEDSDTSNVNEKYIKNSPTSTYYGGIYQPKLNMYSDNEFIKEYNVDLDAYVKTGETVSRGGLNTSKANELEALNTLTHMRYQAFQNQGIQNSENSYKRPQVRKSTLERTSSFIQHPWETTKGAWKDSIVNSVDKMLYGQSVTGDWEMSKSEMTDLAVPIMDVNDIESVDDVTEDAFYGYTTHMHNAHMYKERMDLVSKSNQLENILLSMTFKGKHAKSTNAYKMFQNAQKVYLYGVQELNKIEIPIGGKTLNVTNMLRAFNSAVGLVNVGMNPAVSITAGSSGTIFSLTEGIAGDFVKSSSYKWGYQKATSKSAGLISEVGDVNKSSEIYLLGEKFGIYNLSNRVVGSGYNKFLRTLFKDGIHGSAHLMTEMFTHPFAPTAMYGVLHDWRYVGITDSEGNQTQKVMNFNDYSKLPENSNLTKKEISNRWEGLADMAIANNYSVKDGQIDYSDKLKEVWKNKFGDNQSAIDAEIHYMENAISSVTENLVARVDAKMPMSDKSMASKHALMRFLMTHREWLTINLQNRFKGRQFNYNTMLEEEGSYVTLGKYMLDVGKALSLKNFSENGQKLQEIWNDLSDYEKRNLKRVVIDTAISSVLIAAGALLLAPMVDDERNKDNWAIQYAGYMYFRLASEQMSSGLPGLVQMKDVLDTPIVAYNSIKEILRVGNYSTEEIDRGPYDGHSKFFRLVVKQTFLRHYFDTFKGVNDKSSFFRLQNDATLLLMQKQSKKDKEEKKADNEYLKETYSSDKLHAR